MADSPFAARTSPRLPGEGCGHQGLERRRLAECSIIRRVLRRTALVLAGWAVCLAASAAPSSVSATYDIRLNGFTVAVLTEHYEAHGDTYRLTSESNPIGIFALVKKLAVRFSSIGAVTERGLRPERFDGWRASGEGPEVAALFNWKDRRLTITHDGKTETVSLPLGAQDRLSVMYNFMFLAPHEPGRLAVALTNGRRLDHYVYTVTPDVEADTALGRIDTVHLVRQRDPGDPQNEIWLAPGYGYMPVRMVIVERDGTRYEQLIAKLDVRP